MPVITAAVAPESKVSAQTHAQKVSPILADGTRPEVKPAIEAPAAEAATATTEEPKREMLSPAHAALAKKERALRAQEIEIKSQREAIKKEREEYEKQHVPRSRIKSELLAVAAEEGLSIDDIANLILNPEKSKQDTAYQALEAKFEKKIKDLEDSQENQKKTAYGQALAQITVKVKDLVSKDPEKFETIKHYGYEEAVTKLIEKEFQDTGTVMPTEEAVQFVEDYLVEEAIKPTSLKKVQEKLKAQLLAEQASASATAPPKQQATQGLKTLTNAVQASSRPMSARERAIAAFEANKAQRLAK